MVSRVAREKVSPRANDIDRFAKYPEDMFSLLRELGLFALPLPENYGGSASTVSACLAVEELGRVCYNTAYLLAVQWTPCSAIDASATQAQKDEWLPDLASGKNRASISVTEAQSGSDVRGIKTTAKPVPGGYLISGTKVWCTGAAVSDYIFVAAKTATDVVYPNQGRPGEIHFYKIDSSSKGLTIGRAEDKTGARGISSHPLYLDQVFVPEEHRLGTHADGFKRVMQAFNLARPIHAARGVGLAQGAIDHSIEFIQQRRAFGQTVDSFQGLRWMIADMSMQTEAARSLVYRVAQMLDDHESQTELARMAATAKCFATDVAMKVSTDAVQLFGSSGISADFPINRYMRDAKVLQIIEGTNQIQRNIVSDALLGRVARQPSKNISSDLETSWK